jgi:multidrug efflux pump subunit AcrB
VLGIIVDDAIVIGEAIYVARKNGAPPLKAAIDGVMEVGMPVVAAVTTTMVAFFPLLYVGGFLGKIITILPVVVNACLLISLIECLILLPAHLNHLPDPNRKSQRENFLARIGKRFHRFTNEGLEWFVTRMYQPTVALALRWRYVSLCIALALVLFTWGLWDSGVLKFQFFPAIDGNAMSCVFELPNGTPLESTRDAVARVENAIERMSEEIETQTGGPLLRNIFATAGAKIDERGGRELGSHLGTVRVELLDSSLRGIHTDDLMHTWEEYIGAIPGMVAMSFRGDEVAPPGRPLEVWLTGYDMEQLVEASRELKVRLSSYSGVYQVQDDFREGKKEIRIRLTPEGRMLGVNVADVARQVHAGYYGQEAIRLQRGREDVRVRVRYPEDERNTLTDFENMRIRVPAGPAMPGMGGMGSMAGANMMMATPGTTGKAYREIPLLSVAEVEFGAGYSSINRTDGQRRVVVTAEVNAERANANELVLDLKSSFFPALQRKYPSIGMDFLGEQEEIRKGMSALFVGFPLALIGIYIIIATIFRSYIQPLVIMVTVPFGMCGAFFGHLLLNYDISMMSVFGCVALAGVVVNDAIVLIECVNSHLARGESFSDAVRLGGARRFRPIILTTISTVGGLTPLIMERDYQAQMLIPMAVALAGGVAFATLLTLLLVPCLLGILNDGRRFFRWLFTGDWPTPEEVEPATWRLVGEPDAAPVEASP